MLPTQLALKSFSPKSGQNPIPQKLNVIVIYREKIMNKHIWELCLELTTGYWLSIAPWRRAGSTEKRFAVNDAVPTGVGILMKCGT